MNIDPGFTHAICEHGHRQCADCGKQKKVYKISEDKRLLCRMAGNIAAGVTHAAGNEIRLQKMQKDIAIICVQIAKEIVAHVESD